MTTPIDPDTRIAELRIVAHGLGSIAHFAREAWNGNDGAEGDAVRRLCEAAEKFEPLLALASELAEKLRESEAERYAAIKEMAKARDKAMEAQGDRDVDRILGLEYADGREGAFRAVYDKARELEGANLLNRSAIRNLQTGLAETKRELEQERELVSGCKRTISRFGRVIERLHGFDALAAIVTAVHGACENCDGAGEVISVDTVTHLTCGTCRGSGKKHPPLPACKRCGKPVAHPAQEYCGAACSVERGRAVEGAVCRVCGHLNVACWCDARCPECGGTGNSPRECEACNGTGERRAR